MGKFLFLSNHGDGLGLAFMLKNGGHNVAAHVRSSRSKHNFDRLLTKFSSASQWQQWLDKSTTVVCYNVFMGSKFADTLELDRDAGFEFMSQVGIKYPRTEGFSTWEEGKKFVKGHSTDRWVFKPSGPLAANDAVGSYVSHDADDMCDMLDYYATEHTGPVDFVLQQFLEGVAISTEGWFNGEDWITPFNHTVERKQIGNGNLGPSGGCSGNAVWGWFHGTNHIIEEGIKLIGPVLREFGYVGPIDLNTVVNEEGVWALEWTPRFGYDALPALLQLYEGDFGEWLALLARGERPDSMPLKRGFGSALRISVPPYPSEEFQHAGGIPIRGWAKEHRPDLFFYEVMLNERNHFVTAPAYGAVATITGHGQTIEEAFEQPQYLAKIARIPEKQYRTDIPSTLGMDFSKFERYVDLRRNNNPETGGNP
jgi:phosphoribosylamine--glycine ligase